MKKRIAALVTGIVLTASTVLAAGAGSNSIFGIWTTEGAKSNVEIFNCGEKLCAKIVSLKEPVYMDAKDGPVGVVKTDRQNLDAAKQKRPILGLQIMEGFTPTGQGSWGNGTIYDPENGKTYQCKIKQDAANRLKVRGFIGISLIGRTTVWTR